MRLAVIGSSGLVGNTIIKVLEERMLNISELIPVASAKSVNKEVSFRHEKFKIAGIDEAIRQKPDIAIFSAGKAVSLEYAEQFANNGTYVIDNSSAFRMQPEKKLIVPEVNIGMLTKDDKIIPNPNCSTIQLTVVLAPLHKKYGLKRVVVSTYQSTTGSGKKGIDQLFYERAAIPVSDPAYPHKIDLNILPAGGKFLPNLYSEEEWKLVEETKKILDIKDLKITATVVRVPVVGGHSESVNAEFFNNPDIDDVIKILSNAPGICIKDDIFNNIYPMPIDAYDKDDVFVGRIRPDNSCSNAINFWCTADNLRKGAATNAVQIAEYVYDNFIK